MKKLIVLAFTIVLLSSIGIGCTSEAVDSSAAAPVSTPEEDAAGIEKAMESGQMDPESYGKQ